MIATFALSSLLAAQAAVVAVPPAPTSSIEQRDVAYEELADGRSAEAVAALEAQLRESPDDPATLINLGTAFARQGDTDRAAHAFRAAAASDTRYRLELADGSWADSRQVARRALASLESRYPLAALTE